MVDPKDCSAASRRPVIGAPVSPALTITGARARRIWAWFLDLLHRGGQYQARVAPCGLSIPEELFATIGCSGIVRSPECDFGD
jgi:hypothetical protein